jgi:hypothetical protein
VLASGVLVDWCTRKACVCTSDLLCLPDEVLEKIAIVLGEKEDLGLLDDSLEVGNELLALARQLL